MKNYHVIVKSRMECEVKNSYECNYYRYVIARIYNANKTAYKKFSFIVWADENDVWEHTDRANNHTYSDVSETLDEFEFSFIDMINGYDDDVNEYFYHICKQSCVDHSHLFAYPDQWKEDWLTSMVYPNYK